MPHDDFKPIAQAVGIWLYGVAQHGQRPLATSREARDAIETTVERFVGSDSDLATDLRQAAEVTDTAREQGQEFFEHMCLILVHKIINRLRSQGDLQQQMGFCQYLEQAAVLTMRKIQELVGETPQTRRLIELVHQPLSQVTGVAIMMGAWPSPDAVKELCSKTWLARS